MQSRESSPEPSAGRARTWESRDSDSDTDSSPPSPRRPRTDLVFGMKRPINAPAFEPSDDRVLYMFTYPLVTRRTRRTGYIRHTTDCAVFQLAMSDALSTDTRARLVGPLIVLGDIVLCVDARVRSHVHARVPDHVAVH